MEDVNVLVQVVIMNRHLGCGCNKVTAIRAVLWGGGGAVLPQDSNNNFLDPARSIATGLQIKNKSEVLKSTSGNGAAR
jgi:hypothetical protein